jgi:signal transduction histidine kinase/ABC-type nitrate/sulfonate/bicarbonate transport system substrate-binding protein/FixJ family two-component response regulator
MPDSSRRPQPPTRHRVRWRLVAIALLGATLGVLRAAELQPVTLQLKYHHQFQFAGYYAADLHGFFREEGLLVTINELQPGVDLTTELRSGRCDFAASGSRLFTQWSEGDDLFLVAIIYQRNPIQMLVHQDSAYRSLNDILDLPRERMAGPVDNREVEVWLSLKLLGKDPATFFTQRADGDLARFSSGALDVLACYATNETLTLRAQGVPFRPLSLLPRSTIFPGDLLICRGETARAHPDLVARFRRASLRGWDYALRHTEELVDHIIAQRPSRYQANERHHLLDEAGAVAEYIDADRFPLGEVRGERLAGIAALLRDGGLPTRIDDGLYWHEPSGLAHGLLALGGGLAFATAGCCLLAWWLLRQQRSHREDWSHYQNLVDGSDAYLAFRARVLPGGRLVPELASTSTEHLLGHPLETYQADMGKLCAQLTEEEHAGFRALLAGLDGRDRTSFRFRFRLAHPLHERPRHLMLHAATVVTTRGLFLDGLITDFTAEAEAEQERQRLQQQLQLAQRNESLGLLAGGVAHDFNNLLSAIRGNGELLAGTVTERGKPRLDRLMQAVDRASGLVRQILAYAGRGTIESRPLDLRQETAQIDGLIKHALPAAVATTLTLAEGVPPVLFDPAQFQQVVVNLIMNAAESYEGAPGTVAIALDGDGETVRLTISDQGCGMDDATMARIFDPYFTTKVNGHGLGLAAVQGIMRGVGGEIRCASKRGVGTTFTLLMHAFTRSLAPARFPTPPESPTAAQHVLVADDDDLVRQMTVEMLGGMGYACREAENGAQCQAVLRSARHDLCALVLDCRLGDLDGLDILADLRARGERIPVVLMSGMISADNLSRQLHDQRTRFLPKPFSQAQLRAVLDGLLQRDASAPGRAATTVTDVVRERHREESRRDWGRAE